MENLSSRIPDENNYFEIMDSFEAGMRFLAGGGDIVIDYTVFGMVLFTMILLLIVGAMRHKIDHWAKRNDYFETVLEACYHELSTLGIVEAVIFILHKYWKDLNVQVEMVFAEVHFTLFFVVIINAIMSMLLYFLASRVANNQWVRMEAIDLDHYVAVRKQYDDVNRKLETLELNRSLKQSKKLNGANHNRHHSRQRSVSFEESNTNTRNNHGNAVRVPTLVEASPNTIDLDHEEDTKNFLVWFWDYSVKRSLLKRKKHELLVQVRFHELRVHFIESHQLPPNFRVADYLKLSMIDEFKNLVHVSSLSWGILILITNLIYFTMGIIFATTNDGKKIVLALTTFYLAYAILFVILSSVVFMKMKQVFFKIVKDDSWNEAITERNINHEQQHDHHHTTSERDLNLSERTVDAFKDFNQNDYFWGSNPSIVVTMAQIMQFGYAISFAVLLVFNNTLKLTKSRYFWFGWYPIIPFVCYSLYLFLWCNIMPKYTQCTSLGKLVRRKHLIKIDAISKLSKAKTRRQEEIDNLQAEKEVAAHMEARSKRLPKQSQRQRQKQDSSQSKLLRLIGIRGEEQSNSLDESRNEGSLNQSERLRKLSSLVKKQTENLPDEALMKRRKERRRARSVSDGVAAMRLFSSTSTLAQQALTTSALVEQGDPEVESMKGRLETLPTRPKGRRQKMVSTGVFFMQSEKASSFHDNGREENEKLILRKKSAESTIHHPNGKPPLDDNKKETIPNSFTTPVTTSNFGNSHVKLASHINNNNMSESKIKLTPVHESSVDQKDVNELLDDDLSMDSDDKLDDDLSIESGESFGMRESLPSSGKEENVSFEEKLQQIFLHKQYSMYSALFGTMPVFFFLSVRVETLLIDTCVMEDNQNTWDFLPTRSTTFWVTVVWFCVLIVQSIAVCALFYRKSKKMKSEMVAPAVFDFILTSTCLGLFLWAEFERCCECNEPYSILKAEPTEKDYGCDYQKYECCPSFGTRLCGGLGTIEPFASFIALRPFRFHIARLLMSLFQYLHTLIAKDRSENHDDDALSQEEVLKDDETMSMDEKSKIEHQSGTIAELWMLALAEYPEIVQEHGIFSGLLLEAMLGIDALPKHEGIENTDRKRIETQNERILSLVSHTEERARKKANLKRGISTMSLHSGGGNSLADLNIHDNNFVRPGAPLIRSMRRCECKWEWLKSAGSMQWDIVDVVLTECEIVWFNASANPTYWDETEQKRTENIKRAIIAKKGGKGIRLSDVAAGREVLGRMALTEIDHIRINRFTPCSPSIKSSEENNLVFDLEESRKTICKEFWQESNKMNLPLDKQWEQVIEDRLKLHSNQGTLSLRFFVDLYEVPLTSRDEIQRKKGAILWCESISHLCGKSQLKQRLPHFGENRDNELKDFIETMARTKEGEDKHFWKGKL